jgi:hypothetical protein
MTIFQIISTKFFSSFPNYFFGIFHFIVQVVLTKAIVDTSLGTPSEGSIFQFEREAYFVVDRDSSSNRLVFNRTVTLVESGLKKKEGTGKDKDRSRKEEMQRNIEEKQKKMAVDPRAMFKGQTDLYSKFDADGVPTHDAEGKELSKSAFKKLRKVCSARNS